MKAQLLDAAGLYLVKSDHADAWIMAASHGEGWPLPALRLAVEIPDSVVGSVGGVKDGDAVKAEAVMRAGLRWWLEQMGDG